MTAPPRPHAEGQRLRALVGVAGCVYLVWWFAVEALLPGSFNPLAGRLVVVGSSALLFAVSLVSGWVLARLSALFTLWTCALVGHYFYLLMGNGGESTWWVGAFVTFTATAMCLQSRGEVATFSVFAMACAIFAAGVEGQLRHSIYVPGLATILLLANLTKHSQKIAQDAMLQAELARRERRESDEQRLQLAAIVESSGDAIIASTLDGIVRTWNKGAEHLFGYSADEVIGRPTSLLHLPDSRAEEAELVASLTRAESLVPVETTRRRRDGSRVDVSITMSPIRDSRGDLTGVSMAARDISDRKHAEADVRRAKDAAETANRDLEAFNYSVAHDLRAPLRAIDGFSQAILEETAGSLGPQSQDHLRRVRDAAQRMGRLIDGLLGLAHATRVGIQRDSVDLSELARASAARLKDSDPSRAVAFSIDDGLSVKGDSALLGAVVDNLMNNAWKFTRKQTRSRVEFGALREGEDTVYFVRDNGAGFDMAFASKLFGVFQRLHTLTEFEGTGVGLATVQRIISRHGGRVWAEGKVGEGACFKFTLGA